MASDVRNLLQAIGTPDFEYREVAAIERWQAAAQRWPLLSSVNRTLLERFLAEPAASRPQPDCKLPHAHCVALVGIHGGAGKTTLAANLAQALSQNGRSALAVDLDPQGALPLHFGIESDEPTGLLQSALTHQSLAEWLARFRSGPAVLPFGKLTAALQTSLETTLARDPAWLIRRLQALIPEDREFVLLDLPAATHPLFRSAIAAADTVLVVLSAEPSAYATLPQLESLLDECVPAGGRRLARYVLNRFDARRAFDRDLFASLRGMMGARAVPFAIHADPAVSEALARRKLLMQEAADSQVVASLGNLADLVEEAAAAGAGAKLRSTVPSAG
jgi:cellulose synthase operon protein YhjQ